MIKEDRRLKDSEAALKLARLLAHPQTPEETKRKLEDRLMEFTNICGVQVYHPALAERAATLAFESMSRRLRGEQAEERRQYYDSLHELLDGLEDWPSEEGEQ